MSYFNCLAAKELNDNSLNLLVRLLKTSNGIHNHN